MAAKKEKGRAWTASTFLPETASHTTNLDAISEDAVDEDMLDDEDTAQNILNISSSRLHISSADDDSSSNGSSSGHSSDAAESDDNDENDADAHAHDHDDDDEGNSSQDQGTSEDSDDDMENVADRVGSAQEHNGRKDTSKRSRTGLPIKKKRASIGSLSTSPSKIVSATPTKKITKKSKKSVKAKSSKGSLSTAAARQATEEAKLEAAKPIVSRFLELENTKLNDKLLQVFMINGMIPYVIESITRLDPEIAKNISNGMDDNYNQETKFMTRVKQCRRMRDYSDLDLMKKSYTAMNFLTRNDVYNEFILSSSHQSIVKELFKIFRPESQGNFYHFQKVFETILKKFRAQTMTTLFEDVDSETGVIKTPLIFDMLPFLDQAPVALSMVKVLFPTFTYGLAEKIQDYYKILQTGHFMEMLLAMVTLTEDPSPNMADFVVSLLDEATRAKEAKIVLTCLVDDPIWAERLAQGVQSASVAKRHGCIEIIYSILVRSIQVPFQDMFLNSIYIRERSFDRVESHLERISIEFGKHLAPHIPDLCRAFTGSESSGEQVMLPGYTVPCSFTVARLWLLDSIYHCLEDVKDDPILLESIPEAFWTLLVDSFFRFRFNNAFHVQFYKLFRVVLYSEQATVYDRLFVKTNFVSRLIAHYKKTEQPTGSRGYIILILNCIRLSVELEQKTSAGGIESATASTEAGSISPTFWTNLVRVNQEWENFQETLRAATLEQIRDTLCDMDPNLRFQFAPLQSKHPNEAPLTKRHIGIPGVSARGNDGIDLGSQYSNSLGFGVPMKYDRAAEEEVKKKAEQDHELQVQKALANLMPNVDWRLIPPQRVINAVLGINQVKGEGGAAGKPKLIIPDGKTPVVATMTTTASEGNESLNGSSPASKDGAAPAATKAKKKKKNKKKRQISSVNAEGTADTDEDDHHHSTEVGQSSNGESGSESHPDTTDSEGEGSGTDGVAHKVAKSNGIGSEDSAMDLEEERRERRKEKKREKKRKSKMNKKNRTSTLAENSESSTDSSSTTTEGEAMEL